VRLPEPGPGDVVVRTLASGVSRGTECLVLRGEVPADQREAMRSPHQQGDLPGPVTSGYLAVGLVEGLVEDMVEDGATDLLGRTVFCLHPHQTRFVVPAADVVVVPDGVPAERAVLAGTVETAVNALWDAGPRVGDRVAVVGAGMVGCCLARLLAGIPGVRVTLVDVDRSRAAVAAELGVGFSTPDGAEGDCDLVFHASATGAGLQRSLELLAAEGCVVELSWYGAREVAVGLGGCFHSGRLSIRASQVGTVAPARGRRSRAERLHLALELLRDPAFDALLTSRSTLEELPGVLTRLAAGDPGICHLVTYPDHTDHADRGAGDRHV
jgi:threonine dehydrogenase-like Zn-dependent dehydrogenase